MEEKFQSAVEQCNRFCGLVEELRMTVIEDRPLKDVVKLVEHIGDTVEELLGTAREMHEAAMDAQGAVEHPIDAEHTRRALALYHAKFNIVAERFFSDLASYELVDELISLGRLRRGEWQVWADLVKDTIKEGQQVVFAVNGSLLECWQALFECTGRQIISVQGTNVGQQIKHL